MFEKHPMEFEKHPPDPETARRRDRWAKQMVAEFISGLQPSAPVPAHLLRGYRRKADKYEPCPCGSGKKFKFCCWTPGRGS